MCGIAGIYNFGESSNQVDETELIRITDHMKRRGPDDDGIWFNQNRSVGFGHRRLAIIDTSAGGHQPMSRGSITITYNGEIYNFKELKDSLEQSGHQFTTRSDTEVLLVLFQLEGIQMLNKLVGMFALAIWDDDKQSLFLARDSYGIKPLYYSSTGNAIRFASQVKALLAGGGVSSAHCPSGEVGFLLMGSVPEPWTFYRDIQCLRAGCYLEVSQTGIHAVRSYCSISDLWKQFSGCESDQLYPESPEMFRDSVQRHLVSDVPVGLFLSAGIDSGAIAGLMSEVSSEHVKAMTIRFEEFHDTENDESRLASEIADFYQISHHVKTVTEKEFVEDLPRILDAMDQPSIDGINTWFVSKAASEAGLKAALSGVGGDELLGGYPSFRRIPKWVSRSVAISGIPGVKALSTTLGRLLKGKLINPKAWGIPVYANSVPGAYFLARGLFMPWELSQVMEKNQMEEGLSSFNVCHHIASEATNFQTEADFQNTDSIHSHIAALESSMYMRNQLLRDTDWSSMAHSVEVRTPLVDVKLLEQFVKQPRYCSADNPKAILANAPETALPGSVVNRSKTGFTTPIADWIGRNSELDQWKKIPQLARADCHWSRRYGYSIYKLFQQTI